MSRVSTVLAAALAAALLSDTAFANDAFTTRIEPRGFYGATISIEEGVRVFRPLPPTRHVIVNPGGKTPLSLSYSDVRVDERRTTTNYNYNSGGAAPFSGGHGGFGHGGAFFSGFGKGFHGRRDGGPVNVPGVGRVGGGKGGHH
ncbi:MAG: hypothetical protein CTY20_12550 [Hyphomicrobium sp.]|nr:MAG: hypothetical protein CTY20_12550 [Hyphomicrobium sp.]